MSRIWNTVRRSFATIVDTILPPQARSTRTERRSAADIPLDPQSVRHGGLVITALAAYAEPAIEDLVRSLKYDGNHAAAQLAADIITDYLHESLATMRAFSPSPILIAPVPLHPKRQRERGFNQMVRVLERLPRELRDGTLATVSVSLLVRTRYTPPQTRLSRHERLQNVAGAFALDATSLVPGTRVILVDDVTTTGSTLAHAASPLVRAGAEVTLLALARA
jgi:ComF family protein